VENGYEEPQRIASARQWLTWARAHINDLNPLPDLLGMPETPELDTTTSNLSYKASCLRTTSRVCRSC
ncbi:MAG: hypothetical protein ACREP9_00910, partial [Candidatus Dormibacteraceae bacterium]